MAIESLAAESDLKRDGSTDERPVNRRWARRLLRRPGVVFGTALLLVVVSWALVPGLWSSTDPLETAPLEALRPPSLQHLYGTDELGRDVFTRFVYGTQLTLSTTLTAVALALVLGTVLGVTSGYFGGRVDAVIMRIVDVFLAFPLMLLAMALVTAIGFGATQIAVAVGIAMTGPLARLVRSDVLRVKQETYVEAALTGGAGRWRIMAVHVLPNSWGPMLALAVLLMAETILIVATLSFLGLGVPPPAPEWGSMVSSGQNYLSSAWWIATLPGITIALVIVVVNYMGRELQGEERLS